MGMIPKTVSEVLVFDFMFAGIIGPWGFSVAAPNGKGRVGVEGVSSCLKGTGRTYTWTSQGAEPFEGRLKE